MEVHKKASEHRQDTLEVQKDNDNYTSKIRLLDGYKVSLTFVPLKLGRVKRLV